MPAEPIAILLVMVIGCAAFIFFVFFAVIKLFTKLGEGIGGLVSPGKRGNAAVRKSGSRVCRRERCRRLDHRPDAKYCCQCGGPLF